MTPREKSVIVFGTGSLAKLLWYALSHDSPHEVCAFSVHRNHYQTTQFMGLPVIPFEDLPGMLAPQDHALVAGLGWARMNQARREIVDTARALGYSCPSWVSSRAQTWPDLSIGEHCLIFDGANIQPFARLGNNCIVRSGAVLSHDVELGNDCLVACGASVGGQAKIGDGCVLGLNCTIRDKVSVAAGSFIAAGAVVIADIHEAGVYAGIPARRISDAAKGIPDQR